MTIVVIVNTQDIPWLKDPIKCLLFYYPTPLTHVWRYSHWINRCTKGECGLVFKLIRSLMQHPVYAYICTFFSKLLKQPWFGNLAGKMHHLECNLENANYYQAFNLKILNNYTRTHYFWNKLNVKIKCFNE